MQPCSLYSASAACIYAQGGGMGERHIMTSNSHGILTGLQPTMNTAMKLLTWTDQKKLDIVQAALGIIATSGEVNFAQWHKFFQRFGNDTHAVPVQPTCATYKEYLVHIQSVKSRQYAGLIHSLVIWCCRAVKMLESMQRRDTRNKIELSKQISRLSAPVVWKPLTNVDATVILCAPYIPRDLPYTRALPLRPCHPDTNTVCVGGCVFCRQVFASIVSVICPRSAQITTIEEKGVPLAQVVDILQQYETKTLANSIDDTLTLLVEKLMGDSVQEGEDVCDAATYKRLLCIHDPNPVVAFMASQFTAGNDNRISIQKYSALCVVAAIPGIGAYLDEYHVNSLSNYQTYNDVVMFSREAHDKSLATCIAELTKTHHHPSHEDPPVCECGWDAEVPRMHVIMAHTQHHEETVLDKIMHEIDNKLLEGYNNTLARRAPH